MSDWLRHCSTSRLCRKHRMSINSPLRCELVVERAERRLTLYNQTQWLDTAGLKTNRLHESPSWVSRSLCRSPPTWGNLTPSLLLTAASTAATGAGCAQSFSAMVSTPCMCMMGGLLRGIHIQYCARSWRPAGESPAVLFSTGISAAFCFNCKDFILLKLNVCCPHSSKQEPGSSNNGQWGHILWRKVILRKRVKDEMYSFFF